MIKLISQILDLCRKAEIAYGSAARFSDSPNLIAFCKAHALERMEYQKFLRLTLEKSGIPMYKTKKKPMRLYACKINILNWLNNTGEKQILGRCLAADRKLYDAYEQLIENYNEAEALMVKFRQQYDEIRKAIQEICILIDSAKNKKASTG